MYRFVLILVCLSLLAYASPQTVGAYTVQAGDTPQSIAKKHDISVGDLLKANKDLKPSKMHVGDSINIPGASSGKSDKKHSETTSKQEKASSKPEPASTKERATEVKEKDKEHKASSSTKATSGYAVKKGDTPGSIASKHGVSVDELLKANKGLNPSSMKIGQELVIPGGAPAVSTKAEPAEKPSHKDKAEKTASAPQERTTTYTARKRDTAHSVADKFHISTKELERLNPDMGKKLRSGQKLIVPASASHTREEPVERPVPVAEPVTAPERPTKAAKTPEAAVTAPAVPETRETAEAETHFEKGIELGKQNKFPKAVESFDKAIKLNPNRADFYASRGHANYYMKQYNKAIDDYTKAIEKNPNFALAYSMRGLSRTRSGQLPQAVEDFNKAISFGPNEADYYKGRGFTYLLLEKYAPMCQDYQKACTLGDCELLESAKKEKKCQ
jgi:LysM repeat protein/Flp pilus assembly protein TadD